MSTQHNQTYFFSILAIDKFKSLEYIEISSHSTVSYDIVFGKIEWKSSFVEHISIHPSPLCGPTNITNS